MRRDLLPHPDSPCPAVTRIAVEALRPRPGALVLDYALSGAVGGLLIPPAAAPARADGLWRHSCFEAFVRATPGGGYHEFNFAPSTQWAAYRFGGYRSGMEEAAIAPPRIEARATPGGYRLRASLDLGGLADLPADGPWQIGLAAVIEEAGGRRSWWALAHPPGRPDFHHSDCFALELAAAERP
ncbi:MAG TPA: DOMON-like domain-containing protein [Allosphingosinicella sp.]|nr:DOMON-like domain-containing protein [Allosphingosinicella sp.]